MKRNLYKPRTARVSTSDAKMAAMADMKAAGIRTCYLRMQSVTLASLRWMRETNLN